MKAEFKRLPELKLRKFTDGGLIELKSNVRKQMRKRSIFANFIIYRAITAITLPLIIGFHFAINQYMKTGEANLSFTMTVLFSASIAASLAMLLFFRLQTKSLRNIVDAVVDGKDLAEDLALETYEKSFGLPGRVTAGEFIVSVLFILSPLLVLGNTGTLPFDVREIIMAWWLGTLSLLLSSFLFLQHWVERSLMSLYDYGLRISPKTTGKKKSSLIVRILGVNLAITVTLILLYAGILFDLSSHLPEGLIGRYVIQFSFISLIIVAGAGFFLLIFLGSIKRSFDILQKKMKSIRSGDYSIRILNFRDDQIGDLYEDFDFMVSTLNGVLGTLEDEIAKRTARLEDINARLSKYLSPQLYSKIYQNEEGATLSYARKKLTIFFSDIVSFTHISENLAPEDLSRILNQYLDIMAGVALKWGGTIDKYIGDAIMVFFGDPEFTDDRDHALRCVGMALEMLRELAALREEWFRSGIPYPLHIRIGINTGFCTVGNFGSANRMDYTAIGSAVNLASRLQTAAPKDGILIPETTYLLVNDRFRCEAVGLLRMKGIDQPVKAYRIHDTGSGETEETTELHVEGFDIKFDPETIEETSRALIKKVLKAAYRRVSRPGTVKGN